jgi:RNA polymerase II subunit A C-terminal domain phosphatase SSU72
MRGFRSFRGASFVWLGVAPVLTHVLLLLVSLLVFRVVRQWVSSNIVSNTSLRVITLISGHYSSLCFSQNNKEPRIYKFGVPYEDMYKSLSANPEDEAFFVRNGVLQLCRRGAAVKKAPQRWQDMPSEFVSQHDIVIAFEERIFDAVIEDLQIREPTENFAPIHVICLDTKDNPHEAQLQGQVALDLCWRLEAAQDLVLEAPEIVDQFQQERMTHTPIKVLYQLCYL